MLMEQTEHSIAGMPDRAGDLCAPRASSISTSPVRLCHTGETTMKRCSKCKEIKPVTEFYKDKYKADGLTSQCKSCCDIRDKKYHSKNKGKDNAAARQYHKKHPDKHREASKRSNEKDPERSNRWYKNNRKHKIKQNMEWRKKHPGYANMYYANRRKNDIGFRLACDLRRRLNKALHGKHKSGSAVRDLGCSIEKLRTYLEEQFKPGMSWNNYGRYDPNKRTWNIDHIKPFAFFTRLTKRDQLLAVCNYRNLQPLWWDENCSKGSLYEGRKRYHNKNYAKHRGR
jgi:hypothetical protein